MELVYTRNWYSTVRRPGLEGPVIVEVDFSDSVSERMAVMSVNAADLTVIEARCETYRSQISRSELGVRPLPGLTGVQVYFGCGKAITQALPDDPGGVIAELFKEGVKVLIQAEPMILEERGFSSMDELQQSLWEMLKGSCYYLEQPDCNPSTVRDKLQFHRRKENLFSRHRSVFIYDDGDRYRAFATMSDGWHELQVDITARKNDYEVTDAHGVFVRGPDELCLKSADMLVGIIGQRFSPENIRELTKAGGNGCEHLMDLTREAIRSVHSDWVQRREGMRCPIRGAGGEIALQR